MNLTEYANSVVARTEGVGSEDTKSIVDVITVVLPILTQLPCLANKTPEQKREWVIDHPRLAIINTTHQIRKNANPYSQKVSRKKCTEISEKIINDYLDTTDDDIRLMGVPL